MDSQLIRIAVATEDGNTASLEIEPNETGENLKALIEVQLNIPFPEQRVYLGDREIGNAERCFGSIPLFYTERITEELVTLDVAGVKDGDLLLVKRLMPTSYPQQQGTAQQAATNLGLPTLPTMEDAQAFETGDMTAIHNWLLSRTYQQMQKQAQEMQRIAQLEADPFNPEYQKEIATRIRRHNVDENYQHAMEHTPEAFGGIVMLYIDCEVNKVPVKAFVDTGAQSTIMSKACAEQCNIMHLCDERMAGLAVGVGTAKIVGRVHVAPIKIGGESYPSSFTILEGQGHDFLLGLDMLKKHRAIVDLGQNCLILGDIKTPFLTEQQIPKDALENRLAESPGGASSSGLQPTTGHGQGLFPRPPAPPAATSTTTSTPSNAAAPSDTASGAQGPSASYTAPGTAPVQRAPMTTQSAPPASATPSGPVSYPSLDAQGTQPPPQGVSEEKIARLVEMGFDRQRSIQALQFANGDVDLAATALMGFGT